MTTRPTGPYTPAWTLRAADGVGEVFVGRRPGAPGEVLLRVLDPRVLDDPTLEGRVRRELLVAATVRHPNLARVVDRGLGGAAGERWVAYERLPGRFAAELVVAGPPRAAWALGLVQGVAEALAATAPLGLAHGHLTPSTIFVGDDGQARLLDLGLGPLARGSISPYTAPEVAAGAAPDARADLYALGACLFHLLTGRTPPTGQAVLVAAGSVDAVRIVGALTARDPAARYPSAQRAAEDLRRALAGEPILGPRPAASTGDPRAAVTRRPPAPTAASLGGGPSTAGAEPGPLAARAQPAVSVAAASAAAAAALAAAGAARALSSSGRHPALAVPGTARAGAAAGPGAAVPAAQPRDLVAPLEARAGRPLADDLRAEALAVLARQGARPTTAAAGAAEPPGQVPGAAAGTPRPGRG